MSINSDVNKQMLIEICGGINKEYVNDDSFLQFLDNICDKYQGNRFQYSNIQEINKNILEELVYYIGQRGNNQEKQRQETGRQRPLEMNRELKTIEASELKVQKDEGFSIKLKSREEAFKSLIEKPVPAAVEFADKNQDIPSQNLAVEYDGSYWHRDSEDKDMRKNEFCAENGIKLMRVREEPLTKILNQDVIVPIRGISKTNLNEVVRSLSGMLLDSKFCSNRLNEYLTGKHFLHDPLFDEFKSYKSLPHPSQSLASVNPDIR